MFCLACLVETEIKEQERKDVEGLHLSLNAWGELVEGSEQGGEETGTGGKGSFRSHKLSGQLMLFIFSKSSGIEGGKGKPPFIIIKQCS